MKKVFKFLGFGLVAIIIFGIIAVVSGEDTPGEKTAPVLVPYAIGSKDSTQRQITFRITVQDRVDRSSLVEIARQLKEERKWKEKLVCFFNVKLHSDNSAWASVAYLPKCDNCETDKDADGNSTQFHQIGMSKALADSLQSLTLDTIENKAMFGSFLDDGWGCKTELYTRTDDFSKVFLARLYNDGSHSLVFLQPKDVKGVTRFYVEDEEVYLTVDHETKRVEYYNGEDKLFRAMPID